MSQTKRVSGRATSIVQRGDGFGVQYHRTVVAFKHIASDTVQLNSGGWRTVTTKLRMNQFAQQYCAGAFSVYQKDYDWFVRTKDGDLPFEDGMEVRL